MDDLAAGALVALLMRGEKGTHSIRRISLVLAPVAGVLALGLTVWKHAVIWNPVLQLAGLPLFSFFLFVHAHPGCCAEHGQDLEEAA